MFDSMRAQQASLLQFIEQPHSGLQAVLACNGPLPALLMCRYQSYPDTQQALLEALRLAALRAEQARLLALPVSVAQAVVLRPAHLDDRALLFETLGQVLDEQRGAWSALPDIGTSSVDMRCMAQASRFVWVPESDVCAEQVASLGLYALLSKSLELALGASSRDRLRVALMGLDERLYRLAGQLQAEGFALELYDDQLNYAELLAEECGARAQPLEALARCRADLLVLGSGGVRLTEELAARLHTRVFVDASQCFLCSERALQKLKARGVYCLSQALAGVPDLLYGALHGQGLSYPQICAAAQGLGALLRPVPVDA